MTRSAPPPLATRLLDQFAGPEGQSIIGDLVEQYAEGRSHSWYWRQTLVTIARSTWQGARAHTVPAISGMLVGWAVLMVSVLVLETVRTQLMVGRLIDVKLWWWRHDGPSVDLVSHLAVYAVGAMMSGWLVTRLHRERWPGTVLVFLSSYVLITFGMTGWMAFRVYQDPHVYAVVERVTLASETLMALVVCPMCILVGSLSQCRSSAIV